MPAQDAGPLLKQVPNAGKRTARNFAQLPYAVTSVNTQACNRHGLLGANTVCKALL